MASLMAAVDSSQSRLGSRTQVLAPGLAFLISVPAERLKQLKKCSGRAVAVKDVITSLTARNWTTTSINDASNCAMKILPGAALLRLTIAPYSTLTFISLLRGTKPR